MMNNLIINGVDHAKFDLEWVQKGGVAIYTTKDAYCCFHDAERIRRESWLHIDNAMAVARQLYYKWLEHVALDDKTRSRIKP